ncbi:MAG TPA: CapA family protein [Acidimicrobiales bacterium]
MGRASRRCFAAFAVALALVPVRAVAQEEPAPSPSPPTPRSFTVAATGDILLHKTVWSAAARYGRASAQRFDFRPMFAEVRPVLSAADLAICHLETPIAPAFAPLSSYPSFGVPAEIAQAIAWAGYDRCSTASNHSLDRGKPGIDRTLDVLDAQGVGHSGTARNAAEAAPQVFEVNGVRVSHLSYTYWFNGYRLWKDQPWRANQIDPARIVADAATARSLGAEYVIVSLHWGTEGLSTANAYQKAVAAAVTASGQIDLVLGHHAHVVQPIAVVNGHWVAYGLSNFLSGMFPTGRAGPRVADGMIVQFRITERPEGGFNTSAPSVVPTWVQQWSYVVTPTAQRGDLRWSAYVRRLLGASEARTRRVVGPYVV